MLENSQSGIINILKNYPNSSIANTIKNMNSNINKKQSNALLSYYENTYKLYKKKIAKLVFSKLKSSGFDHDLEIVLFLKSKRIKIKELPVKWIHINNSSLNIFWDPIKMLVGIFLLKFRNF